MVYVDNDPVVLSHARALLTSGHDGATGYLDADARDVGKILTESRQLLDFSQPVGVMLVAILQFIEDKDDPYRLVAQLIEAVPPGQLRGDLAPAKRHAAPGAGAGEGPG